MKILRKALKSVLLIIFIFTILTAMLALLINMTSFKENWSFPALITIVSVVCYVGGFLFGRIINKRGVVTGIITSILTVEFFYICVQLVFMGEINNVIPNIFYLISVLFGTVGSVVAVNTNK